MPTITHIVRSQSSREGARPKAIVLHTTEGHDRPGISDLEGLAEYFDHAEASSHVANDGEGNDIRMVPDERKAWTCCNFNPITLNLEQIGFASYSKRDWFKREEQLHNTAAHVHAWCQKYDIPYQRGRVIGSRFITYGIVGHMQLGQYGCGHSDPGVYYPFGYVIGYARLHTLKKGSRQYKRLLRSLNRQRKRYGLRPLH